MKFVNLAPYWPLLLGLALGALLGYFGQCTSGTCPLTSTWWRGALYGGLLGLLFVLSSPRSAVPPSRTDPERLESPAQPPTSTKDGGQLGKTLTTNRIHLSR
ncbi:MAG: DUF6132 family protein [Spartobacteria bacterium]